MFCGACVRPRIVCGPPRTRTRSKGVPKEEKCHRCLRGELACDDNMPCEACVKGKGRCIPRGIEWLTGNDRCSCCQLHSFRCTSKTQCDKCLKTGTVNFIHYNLGTTLRLSISSKSVFSGLATRQMSKMRGRCKAIATSTFHWCPTVFGPTQCSGAYPCKSCMRLGKRFCTL